MHSVRPARRRSSSAIRSSMRLVQPRESLAQSEPSGTRPSGNFASSTATSSSVIPSRWAKTIKAIAATRLSGNFQPWLAAHGQQCLATQLLQDSTDTSLRTDVMLGSYLIYEDEQNNEAYSAWHLVPLFAVTGPRSVTPLCLRLIPFQCQREQETCSFARTLPMPGGALLYVPERLLAIKKSVDTDRRSHGNSPTVHLLGSLLRNSAKIAAM